MNARSLQFLNAVVLLGMCLWGVQNLLHLLFALLAFAVLFVGSVIYHLLVGWWERRRGLATLPRVIAYLLPALALIAVAILGPDNRRPNQQRRSVSPSGAYVLTVPIEGNHWTVTIRDRKGHLLFRDNADFAGQFSAYWVWDPEDRVWLYNSDDGAVYFWEAADGTWRRTLWGSGRKRDVKRKIEPPEALYPEYARARR